MSKTQAQQLGLMLGAVAMALVLGFALGRWTAPAPKAITRIAQAPVAQTNNQTPSNARPRYNPVGQQGRALPGSLWARAHRTRAKLMAENAKKRPRMKLNEALAIARRSGENPDDKGAAAATREAAFGLYTELTEDHRALKNTISRFASLESREEAGMVAAVLGQIRDPEVEQMALELARHSRNPVTREAAFDILDGLETPGARAVALEALSTERDTTIRRAALRAIPEAQGATEEDASEVVARLTKVLQSDTDVESRRRAAVLLGSWHRNTAELAPVLQSLASDRDPGVRAGCAFACEISGRRDPSVINALAQSLARRGEDPLVRDNCYRALKAMGPLPAAAGQIYVAYEQELDERGEGEGG